MLAVYAMFAARLFMRSAAERVAAEPR